MNFITTCIPGVHVVEMDIRVDERGIFSEAYNSQAFAETGLPMRIDQMNVSVSARKGTIRGMHWQLDPFGQIKLVRCVKGRACDVAVDVRRDSPTYGAHVAVELTPSNRRALCVPRGCAHGWQALADESEIAYLIEGFWNKSAERGLRPNDSTIAVPWPIPPLNVSERDRTWPLLEQI
jgi:dTDP-4-dehydrorhamnose 3,5-epimerase